MQWEPATNVKKKSQGRASQQITPSLQVIKSGTFGSFLARLLILPRQFGTVAITASGPFLFQLMINFVSKPKRRLDGLSRGRAPHR
jgi:hypothetical protein